MPRSTCWCISRLAPLARFRAWRLPGRAPAALLTLVLAGCTQFFFQPQRQASAAPDLRAENYRAERLAAADGTMLSAWYFPARTPAGTAGRTTVLFLHGNAENLSTQFRSIAWMPEQGLDVLALDYRGYGESQGVPTLRGVQLDIDAAMDWLLTRHEAEPRKIVLFGQSLGGALAIYYAAHGAHRASIRALVVDSAFSDCRVLAREKLAGLWLTWPLQWLPWITIDDDYSPKAAIAAVSPIPLLLIQGGQDDVVPAHHAHVLFDAAAPPKELWFVPEAGHIQSLRNETRRRDLVRYLDHLGP